MGRMIHGRQQVSTWLKGKKNIHVFVQPNGSHLARIGTLPQKEKEEAIELIKEWLEE